MLFNVQRMGAKSTNIAHSSMLNKYILVSKVETSVDFFKPTILFYKIINITLITQMVTRSILERKEIESSSFDLFIHLINIVSALIPHERGIKLGIYLHTHTHTREE